MEWVLPTDVIVISRTDLLKYISTCNPKTKRNATIEKYIVQIKNTYPIVEKVERISFTTNGKRRNKTGRIS